MGVNIWKSYVCRAVEETNIESILAVSYEHYWTSNWNKAWKKIQAWYRKSHGFKTRTGLIFFQVLFQLLVQ